MTEEENFKQVDLGDKVKGEIELPKLDVSKYVGQMAEIETVTENEGNFGYFIKVVTKPLETITRKKDNVEEDVEIKASKIFGLQTDEQGNLGWGRDTKLGVFLAKMGVSHYRNLPGMTVQVTKRTDKKGSEFLTFE